MEISRSSLLVAGLIGGVSGFLISRALEEPPGSGPSLELQDPIRTYGLLRRKVARLMAEKLESERLNLDLRRLLDVERGKRLAPAQETEPEGEQLEEARSAGPPNQLTSAAEVNAISAQDLNWLRAEGLLDVAAALLALREPDYEKLIDLLGRLDEKTETKQ